MYVYCRYRMVAKDFTLQQSVLPLSRVWVECHERMARWFILMDHRMQAAGELSITDLLYRTLLVSCCVPPSYAALCVNMCSPEGECRYLLTLTHWWVICHKRILRCTFFYAVETLESYCTPCYVF